MPLISSDVVAVAVMSLQEEDEVVVVFSNVLLCSLADLSIFIHVPSNTTLTELSV